MSKRLHSRFETYDKMGLTYNRAALHGRRKVSVINKFFKKDANIELNKYIAKEKEKDI